MLNMYLVNLKEPVICVQMFSANLISTTYGSPIQKCLRVLWGASQVGHVGVFWTCISS